MPDEFSGAIPLDSQANAPADDPSDRQAAAELLVNEALEKSLSVRYFCARRIGTLRSLRLLRGRLPQRD